jgi:hypothetical protein
MFKNSLDIAEGRINDLKEQQKTILLYTLELLNITMKSVLWDYN